MDLHSLHPKLAARLAVAKHREDRTTHTLALILQHPKARVVFDLQTYLQPHDPMQPDPPVTADSIAQAKAAQREQREAARRETGLEIDEDGRIRLPEAGE